MNFFLYFILNYTLPVFYIFIQCKCLYVPFVSKCTCIYLVYIYRSIICCFVPNAFCSYNSICYFCLQVTFIELYTCTGTSITSENGDKIEIIRLHCLFHLQSKSNMYTSIVLIMDFNLRN